MKKKLTWIVILILIIIALFGCEPNRPPKTFYINSLPSGVVLKTYYKGRNINLRTYFIDIQTSNDIVSYDIPLKYYRYINRHDTINHKVIKSQTIKEELGIKESNCDIPQEIQKNKPIKLD